MRASRAGPTRRAPARNGAGGSGPGLFPRPYQSSLPVCAEHLAACGGQSKPPGVTVDAGGKEPHTSVAEADVDSSGVRRRRKPAVALPTVGGCGRRVARLNLELRGRTRGPDHIVIAPSATELRREAIGREAVAAGLARRHVLAGTEDAAHPPVAAGAASAVASRQLLRKRERIRGAVNDFHQLPLAVIHAHDSLPHGWSGGEERRGRIAEQLKVGRDGAVAGGPVEPVTQSRVAGALIDRYARLTQPGVLPRYHPAPGGPQVAGVDDLRRVRVDLANGRSVVQPVRGLVHALLFDIGQEVKQDRGVVGASERARLRWQS